MSGTAQDITELRIADEQAAEATRRLFLLQQMAMAANRATSLREALLMAGAGVPEHTTWAAVCAYLYDVPGDEPELLDMRRQRASAVAPDPALAERARATGVVDGRHAVALAETHSAGRDAGPARRRGRLRGRAGRRRGPARRELPPD